MSIDEYDLAEDGIWTKMLFYWLIMKVHCFIADRYSESLIYETCRVTCRLMSLSDAAAVILCRTIIGVLALVLNDITLCPNTSNYLGRVFTEYSMYLGRVNNALSRRNSCR